MEEQAMIFGKRTAALISICILAVLTMISACGAPEPPDEPQPPDGSKPSQPGTTQTPTPQPAPPEEKGASFAWKITSDVSSVYLLGSIHVASPDIYPLDNVLETAYLEADNLAVEVDVTAVDDAVITALVTQYGTYPEGDGFKQSVPQDLYSKLEAQFGKWGIPLAQMNGLRPWLILTTLEQLVWQDLGYISEYGIDYYFLEKANSEGKDIIELESAEFQLKTLSSLPDDLMVKAMEAYMEDILIKEDAEELFEAWVEGDTDAMEALVFQALIDYPELKPYSDAMFDERDFKMAENIEDYLADSETYFIVVGAGHLVGENGLLNLLDDRGYKLEQLQDLD
jgi:uncharacterized protein YbaP (TraB family)